MVEQSVCIKQAMVFSRVGCLLGIDMWSQSLASSTLLNEPTCWMDTPQVVEVSRKLVKIYVSDRFLIKLPALESIVAKKKVSILCIHPGHFSCICINLFSLGHYRCDELRHARRRRRRARRLRVLDGAWFSGFCFVCPSHVGVILDDA